MRQKRIQYAIDHETGLTLSRCDDKIYFPVLDFGGMNQQNGFKMTYQYEEDSCFLLPDFGPLTWTRKIPTEAKNFHRKHWGFKPLKTN